MLDSAPPADLPQGKFKQLMVIRYTAADGLPSSPALTITQGEGKVFAVGNGGAFQFDGRRWKPVQSPESGAPRGVPGGTVTSYAPARGGATWAATPAGVFAGSGDKWRPIAIPQRFRYGRSMPNADTEFRGVSAAADGVVWIATSAGAIHTDGADEWYVLDGSQGMPYEDMTCIAAFPNGDVWGGTSLGAWRLRGGEWRYFHGRRWLPGDRVNAIAAGPDGSAWIATDGGVSHITEQAMTLEQKAAYYEKLTQSRHSRRGWISGCRLKEKGNPEGGIIADASDNDGLWTAIYVAAEAFRYGATRSPEAREHARTGMNAMLDLVRLSGYPGYPARAIVRKDEGCDGFNPTETVRVAGETDPIWYQSPVDPSLMCKGDTSSDELDGHYFGWYVYYELVADKKEKEEIARICRAVTDNLLSHNFNLIGHTGRVTRWGVFEPAVINSDPHWIEERGLNSLSLLNYFKVAIHICGDKRFLDAYETLVREHHYLQNTLLYRNAVVWPCTNYSDDELAYCDYYPLLCLERDPERRAILMHSLENSWRGLRNEDRTWFNVTYGALTGRPCRIEEARKTLEDWPWDMVNWQVANSHRHDVKVTPKTRRTDQEINKVLPMSERPLMRWNANPWNADGDGDGMSEEDGGAWLLGYWMGRYHRLLD